MCELARYLHACDCVFSTVGVLTQNTILLGRNEITNYCYNENETLMFVCSVEDSSHHAAIQCGVGQHLTAPV